MITFLMEAQENYDPATVAEWNAATQPNFCFQDKQYLGHSFDAGRRKIMYSELISRHMLDGQGQLLTPNVTGQTLWSGIGAIPPGNQIDESTSAVFRIFEKDIDTGVVRVYDPYDSGKLVPLGIGGGGITGLSITTPGVGGSNGVHENLPFQGGSSYGAMATITVAGNAVTAFAFLNIGGNYQVGDVLSALNASSDARFTITAINSGSDGATWGRFVFDTTLFGGDIRAIVDPRTNNFWVHMQSCELYLFRFSDDFVQIISPLQPPFSAFDNTTTDAEPIGVTASWVYFRTLFSNQSKLQILPSTISSPEITADCLLATYTYDYPDNTYYWRQCIGSDGNMYVFGAKKTGTRAYKLWSAIPGVGFTDITPWSASTGPNTNCAAWTTNGSDFPPWAKHYLIQLHASGNLVCISKFYPDDTPGHGGDAAFFRIDATYYNIAGDTFDYHEGFVTGYMTAAWASTALGSADWLVTDFREFNNYLDASDYAYPGADYTKRWFMFKCQAMSGGVPVDGNTSSVFVEYSFVSGNAPAVVQVIAETGWDAAYPAYAATAGRSEIVSISLPQEAPPAGSAFNRDVFDADSGLYDTATNAFWLSGDNPIFCDFNAAFSPRRAQSVNGWGLTQTAAASSPFLKLSFGSTPSGPILGGKVYTRYGQPP